MKPKKDKKKFAWNPKNKTLYNLMASSPGVLAINWVFQGMLGMDKSELIFHISIDIILSFTIFTIINSFISTPMALLFAIIIAHTFNWLFNSHFWVMGRYIGITQSKPEIIQAYTLKMQERMRGRKSVVGVLIFGKHSREREQLSTTSDVDVRIISKNNFLNLLNTNLLIFKEKIIAFFLKFPLDIYVYDNLSKLGNLREDEKPIIVYDPKNILTKRYESVGYSILQQ